MNGKFLLKAAVSIVILTAIAATSYYWGYMCGKQEISAQAYDRSLFDLANDVLIRDALESGKASQAYPLVVSRIENEFARVVELRGQYSFESSEPVRCAVSRRIRVLKRDGMLFIDEKTLKEAGYPLDNINDYLDRECPGEPTHLDWSSIRSGK